MSVHLKDTAFIKYLNQSYGDDAEKIAMELYVMTMNSTTTPELVYELLELTGDKEFNKQTFFKAANLAISMAKGTYEDV